MEEETFSVVNNLISTSATDALSAYQGKVLNEKILAIQEELENVATDSDIDAIFTASN